MQKRYSLVVNMLLSILLLSPILSFSQETTADIAGIVTSQDGPVPGASVLAVHQPTGTRYMTVTRKDGRYNLPNLCLLYTSPSPRD